ncbi:translocation/assembly module TamB domain-containing protein [Sphingomonas sp.]|uniref:translocation/assembly module TamB domain-containing protein n=1 Tax=Sphingomonas sp. TaxID=28214 RepID=UPI003B00F89C
MEEGTPPAVPAARPKRRRPVLRAIAGLLFLATLFLIAVGIGIDTAPGHRFIADRIAELHPASGLRIHVGRIDGSIWRHTRIRDLRLSDSQGVFLEAPAVELDWRPGRWLANRLHVDRLASDLVILRRLPKLRPTGQEGPFLPGYAIHLGRVDLRLRLEPGLAGPRRLVRLVGRADTARGRALVSLAARSSAGDRLRLALDTRPDADIFDLDARLDAPGAGVVPALLGSRKPVALAVGGSGRWSGWRGRARLDVGGTRVADLSLAEKRGRYALSGRVTPASVTQGKVQRLTAPVVAVSGSATYADRRVSGRFALRSPALALDGRGAVDLARGTFAPLQLGMLLRQPHALFPNMSGTDVRLSMKLDGPFRRAAFRYLLTAPRVAFDKTGFEVVRAQGAGRLGGSPVAVPLALHAARVTGIGAEAGGILANVGVTGMLRVTSKALTGQGLALRSDKLSGRLALFVDLVTGKFLVDVSGGLQRYLIPNLGIVDVLTELKVRPTADDKAAIVSGRGRAWVRRFDNAFLRGLAGGLPQIDTALTRTPDGILHLDGTVLIAPAIRLTGSGIRRKDGSFQFSGSGRQATYGSFRLALDGQIDHPQIRATLDRPADALGLIGVAVALDPTPAGFALRAQGGSTLGPFTLVGAIDTPANAPTVIHVGALDVTGTRAKGDLRALSEGLVGRLGVAGGGLSGTIDLATLGALQRVLLHLGMQNARLGGDAGTAVRRGRVDADLVLDPAGTRVEATASAQGLRRGSVFLARANLSAKLSGGRGQVRVAVAGSRGRAFAFQSSVDVAPDAWRVSGGGQIDGAPVTLAAPATIARAGDEWRLAPMSIGYGGGGLTLSGRFGGPSTAFDTTLNAVPLTVLDMLKPGLGLGGAASGKLAFARAAPDAAPTARADLTVRGLTRAGLVLSSRPVDLGLAAALTADGAAMRAVAASGGRTIGRAQAQLRPLASGGSVVDRLMRAPLFAQFRYAGPVDTPWRLTGIETIDLSGPVAIGADVGGTAARPLIRGSLSTQAMRLESSTTGTVITGIRAAGRFDGSRLVVDRFIGATPGDGQLSGRAAFDFAAAHGLGMDIALDASHAMLLARDDIGATVTGPLTLKSDGAGGAIAGKVRLDRATYRLGRAATAGVPRVALTELNRPADVEDQAPPAPWTLDLVTDAKDQLFVRGLGLDSEWRAKLAIKGVVDEPAITGRLDLVRGNYEFAGRRFDLDRGIIRFTGSRPVDPALDIAAGANLQGINATIRVGGTGTKPELDFTSVPALPEDELLSRLLFGTSIANLSAPEALQLASAVNSLRTGGGRGSLDPINAIRKVAHLDRLRIEAADVTTGQKTSIAAGKYIGRRTYVELVTDGQGYSATRVEFQVTRWLSLLSTISTIGRQSANVRVSKDY